MHLGPFPGTASFHVSLSWMGNIIFVSTLRQFEFLISISERLNLITLCKLNCERSQFVHSRILCLVRNTIGAEIEQVIWISCLFGVGKEFEQASYRCVSYSRTCAHFSWCCSNFEVVLILVSKMRVASLNSDVKHT